MISPDIASVLIAWIELPKIWLPWEEKAVAGTDIDWVATELADFIELGISIVTLTGVLAFTIVGIMFMTAWWDEEKSKKAIKYAVAIGIGIVLAMSAITIITFIDATPGNLLDNI